MNKRLPVTITIPNIFNIKLPSEVLTAVGYGEYPYDCKAKDKHPDAMIYKGEYCWTSSESEDFLTFRDKSLDVYDNSGIPGIEIGSEIEALVDNSPVKGEVTKVSAIGGQQFIHFKQFDGSKNYAVKPMHVVLIIGKSFRNISTKAVAGN